ncbi:high-affinity nickel-transport protein [Deinobacterium chartae]|uniref:Nickel/cobalt efflux system n=1 Tax=Deinobacterium chartae TaxID=521158 RepID=A0A841I226_9DEIO|nr:nickel transporter [Deinobacterium chartae]MBB6098439.1 high-affinity nickel-transport protein [Deinobacterium chartae]
MDLTVLALVFALGLRHGLDADHLAAIDGLSRLRPSPWNGLLFALGHGGVVTLLAVLAGQLLSGFDLEWLSPWLFLLLAAVNLYRLLRPGAHTHPKLPNLGPLALGIVLAVGFETSSQLAALSLSSQVGPLWLGAAFTVGMMCSDGVDGLLASRIQQAQGQRAAAASRAMGWLVVLVSLGFALSDFAHVELEAVALPLGLALFAALVGLRWWALRAPRARAAA